MHVVIIGGGIGGLTLAHGLRRRGVSVSVHERDARPDARWEGYRIHIDPHGMHAFRACLPAEHVATLEATGGHERALSFVTEGLDELLSVPGDVLWPAGDGRPSHLAVDRRILRRVLLHGLEDVVTFGAEVVGYTELDDGRVRAEFADGSSVTGDVLVGADGAGSRIARRRLPDAERTTTGAIGLGGKLPLTAETRGWLPDVLLRGLTVTTTSASAMLFTAAFDPPAGVGGRLAEFGLAEPPDPAPYLLNALVLATDAIPGVTELAGTDLRRAVDAFVAEWHPTLRRVLAESDGDTRLTQVFRASDPPPAPWAPSRVTLLGDAVHQMPPVGGMGGNTALRDAALLTRTLTRAAAGTVDPVAAIGAYEVRMREYGFAVMADALRTQRQTLAPGRLRTTASRTFFRTCARFPALRDRIFGSAPAERPVLDAEDTVGNPALTRF